MLMTVANVLLLRLAKEAHMVTMEICSYRALVTDRCFVAFNKYNENIRLGKPYRNICFAVCISYYSDCY